MQTLTRKELAEVIGEKTLHLRDQKSLAEGVAAYLASTPTSVDFSSLMRDVMQYRQDHGIIEAVAVSAHELDDRAMADIKQLLHEHFPDASSVIVASRIDTDIVGGVRIELPQENLDLSVKSKLNTFKRLVADERN